MPFHETVFGLALTVLSLVLVAAARCAAPYLMKSSATASSVGTFNQNASTRAVDIESKAEEEERMFLERLDPQAFIVGFLNKEDEELFAKTLREGGIKELRTTLMLIVPFINLIEGVIGLVLYAEVFSYGLLVRVQIAVAMVVALVLYLGGLYFPKKSVSTALYPYVSIAFASLFTATVFIFIWAMVRIGALSGKSPWDGESRLLLAIFLIFVPRMLPMPIGFSTALNIVSAVALELLLYYVYAIYRYTCSCYRVTTNGGRDVVSA